MSHASAELIWAGWYLDEYPSIVVIGAVSTGGCDAGSTAQPVDTPTMNNNKAIADAEYLVNIVILYHCSANM